MVYQRPGVYINTSLTPITPGATAPGQSTAAFVGVHSQGPTIPTLITSWNQFVNLYGGFGDGSKLLPFAIWQYFANNGNQCYVVRAAATDAVAANKTLNDREVGAGGILPPTNVVATPGGTTVPSQLYGYTVTAVNGAGETNAGIEATVTANATLSVSNNVVITWTPVVGATGGYRIYRRNLTLSGPQPTPLLLTTVPGQPSSTFTDNGSYTPAGAIPLYNTTGTPVPILKFVTSAVGAWGNNIYVDITDSSTGNGRVSVVVRYGGTSDANIVERFIDVTMNRTDPRYLVSMINSTVLGSKYIRAIDLGVYTTWTPAQTPQTQSAVALTGGSDGVANPSLLTATQQLATIQGNLDINLPGISDTSVLNPVLNYTNTQPNMFVVVDTPPAIIGSDGVTPSESATVQNYLAMVVGNTQITPTSQAAIYGPWLQVSDPTSTVAGATKTLPPGGAVLGIYSQTDAKEGVQKAPAGVNTPLQRTVGVELAFQNSNLDSLNSSGININRFVAGYGFCVMGTRTLLPSLPSRYVPIQRTLMNIEYTLTQLTQFAIFENNNSALWSRLSAVVTQYLQGIWQQGKLQGDNASQAFFVQCDAENNTATSIAAGEVHIKVGLALNTPAEFVVIDINQMSSNATTVLP